MKSIKLFGCEISIKKIKKSIGVVSDEKLTKLAIQKYLKEEITMMGLWGDVERGLVIGYLETFNDDALKCRCVRFRTDNKEYPTVFFTEHEILNNK